LPWLLPTNGKTAEIGAGSISCVNDARAQPIAVANTTSQSQSTFQLQHKYTDSSSVASVRRKLINGIRSYPVLL